MAGIHGSLTRSTIADGGTVAEQLEQDVRATSRALGDAADRHRPGVFATQPSRPSVHRLAEHEIAEADALDAPDDRGVERGRCLAGDDRRLRPAALRAARRGRARRG